MFPEGIWQTLPMNCSSWIDSESYKNIVYEKKRIELKVYHMWPEEDRRAHQPKRIDQSNRDE